MLRASVPRRAMIASLTCGGLVLEPGDLAVQHADQRAQRGDLAGVWLRQRQPVQPDPAAAAEDIGAGDRDAALGQHRVHLVLAGGALADQLVPLCRGPDYADAGSGGLGTGGGRVKTSA
jgi:hypothetical protein